MSMDYTGNRKEENIKSWFREIECYFLLSFNISILLKKELFIKLIQKGYKSLNMKK